MIDTALNDTALSKNKTGLHLFLQAGACLFVYIYKFRRRDSNLSAFYFSTFCLSIFILVLLISAPFISEHLVSAFFISISVISIPFVFFPNLWMPFSSSSCFTSIPPPTTPSV